MDRRAGPAAAPFRGMRRLAVHRDGGSLRDVPVGGDTVGRASVVRRSRLPDGGDERGIQLAYANSGESQTTVDCAGAAAARGIPVLAVTGHEGSRLARLADHVLLTTLPAAPVAASHTTSHTAMIA